MSLLLMQQDSAVMTGGSIAILDRIVRPEVHLALWERALPDTLLWARTLDLSAIDDLDFIAPVDRLDIDIADGLAEAGYPVGANGAALRDELVILARRFAEIMGCDAVKIRLEVVETDACRKFHADQVRARLITTLIGQATQWVHTDAGPDEALHQLRAGDVGLFKGRLWADVPQILHRSPPIAGTGSKRLLLVLDPADAVAQG